MHGDLLLLHGAQVAGADSVANLRKIQGFLIRGCRAIQHLLAPAGIDLGGERVLDLAECTRADAAVVGNRLRAARRNGSALGFSRRGRLYSGASRLGPRSKPGFRGLAARTARSKCC